MLRSLALMMVVLAGPAGAAAQDHGVFTRSDPEVSDSEVIRWAAREVGREDGREVGERPPPPPDPYLAHDPHAEAVAIEGEDDGLRLLAEIGGGALGMLIGGGVGALIVWAALEGNASPEWMMIAGGSATVLTALGVSSGVALGADATGSRGNFGYAFIGQALGAAAAAPLVVIAVTNDAPEVALVPATLLPLAGAVLAYELAHLLSRAHDGPGSVVAYLSPTPDGVMGGVAGRVQ